MVSHVLRHDLAMIVIRHALRHACITFALRKALRHALRHALGLAKAFSLKFPFPTGPGRSHVAKTQPLCSESVAFMENVVKTSSQEGKDPEPQNPDCGRSKFIEKLMFF